MEEKKRLTRREQTLCLCMLLILFAFVVSGVAQLGAARNARQTDVRHAAAQTQSVAQNAPAPRYVLRLYQGSLAVFSEQNPETPLRVTEISQYSLRAYDKAQLERGITVEGDAALAMILEDFGS